MRVTVVGLGKLGAPLAAVMAMAGNDVMGCDLDEEAVRAFESATCHRSEPGLRNLLRANSIPAITDLAFALARADVACVVVPTPTPAGEWAFDSSAVRAVARRAAEVWTGLDRRPVLDVVSTVMPGTCGSIAAEYDLSVAYTPAFIALGSVVRDLHGTETVIVGCDDVARVAVVGGLWRSFTKVPAHYVSTLEAEVAKISVNAFLCTKASFANEVGRVCTDLGADPDLVLRVIGNDSRIGGKFLKAGAPYGGPCLPRDALAFASLGNGCVAAAAHGVNESMITAAATWAPDATVGVLGLTYKVGTPVTTDSAGWKLAEMALRLGHDVYVSDPDADEIPVGAVPLEPEELMDTCDHVVVATPHPGYDQLRVREGQTVIDYWGRVKGSVRP